MRELGQGCEPESQAVGCRALFLDKTQVDLRFAELAKCLKMLCVQTVFKSQAKLDERLWLADQFLEAPSEVARRTEKQRPTELDDLLDKSNGCARCLKFCEIARLDLLQRLEHGVFLSLPFFV